MKQFLLALLGLNGLNAETNECYHDDGQPRRCSPPFLDIARAHKNLRVSIHGRTINLMNNDIITRMKMNIIDTCLYFR